MRCPFLGRHVPAAHSPSDGCCLQPWGVNTVAQNAFAGPARSAGAPEAAAPRGLGDGAFQPLRGAQRVVAVVGTAHVRGMVRGWQAAVDEEQRKGGWEAVAQLLRC